MAKYDQGGGCSCGVQRICTCGSGQMDGSKPSLTAVARTLYEQDNAKSSIHSNREPTWDELGTMDQMHYVQKAFNVARIQDGGATKVAASLPEVVNAAAMAVRITEAEAPSVTDAPDTERYIIPNKGQIERRAQAIHAVTTNVPDMWPAGSRKSWNDLTPHERASYRTKALRELQTQLGFATPVSTGATLGGSLPPFKPDLKTLQGRIDYARSRPTDLERIGKTLDLIRTEVSKAITKWPPVTDSPHHHWGVMFEEVDEVWDEVKADNIRKAREEAIQVAAMAIRFILEADLPGWARKPAEGTRPVQQ